MKKRKLRKPRQHNGCWIDSRCGSGQYVYIGHGMVCMDWKQARIIGVYLLKASAWLKEQED